MLKFIDNKKEYSHIYSTEKQHSIDPNEEFDECMVGNLDKTFDDSIDFLED